MAVTVRIPTHLRKFTQDQADVAIEGSTIGDVINNLEAQYGGIKERIVDESGAIRRFVNVYVNEEDIRFLDGPNTPVKNGDQVTIVPAIAGGCAGWE
jgi:molybdopterin synthase sulfur carrier subunit